MPRKLYVGKSNRIKLESSRGVTTTATQRVYRLRKVHDIKEIGIKSFSYNLFFLESRKMQN